MTTVENARLFAATLTANGPLVAGRHTPVDASGGARTMTLPLAPTSGAHLSVEKRDASANAVIVSGSIRGASTTISLVWQFETVTLRYDGGTWIPTEGHKTKSSLDATYAPRSNPNFSGLFSIGGAQSAAYPFSVNQTVQGPAAVATGATNIVGTQINTTFSGDYTGMAGADPGFVFGGDHYTVVGSDAQGITTVEGWIGEVAVSKTSGTIQNVIGTEAGVSFDGASTAVTVNTAISLMVANPGRLRNGAHPTIGSAYSLYVNEATGGSSPISLFVQGGVSRFMGRVDVANNITNAGGGNFDLNGAFSAADAAALSLQTTANGGHVLATVPNNNAFLFVSTNGGGVGFAANGAGAVGIGAYPDTGGAVGPAVFLKNLTTAPAGNPVGGGVLYVQSGALKYRGSSGTVTTLGTA